MKYKKMARCPVCNKTKLAGDLRLACLDCWGGMSARIVAASSLRRELERILETEDIVYEVAQLKDFELATRAGIGLDEIDTVSIFPEEM